MGFFDFARRKQNPTHKTSDNVVEKLAFDNFVDEVRSYITKTISWSKLFASGRSLSGVGNSPYKKIASVYKPVKAIVDNVPQAKIVFYNMAGEMVDDRLFRERFAEPSVGVSYNEFIGQICGYLALYGEAFVTINTESVGEIAGNKLPSMVVRHPKDVNEIVDKQTGLLTGWTIGNASFPVDQVIVIKDFNPDNPHRGLSPQSPLAMEMEIDYYSLLYNKKFFENDATAGIILESERGLTDEQTQQLRQAWNEGSQGVKNAFMARVLGGGIKVKQTAQTHKEMDFIEQKKLVRDEITGNWRVPKSMFNVTDSINYATFQGQMKMFWQYQIVPMLRKVEDAVNMTYMKRYSKGLVIGFDFKNVPAFAEDMKDKAMTAEALYRMGFTRNEINEELELGFEAKPWGDDFWIGAGMMPASAWTDDDYEDEEGEQGQVADNSKSVVDVSIDKAFSKFADVQKGFIREHEKLEAKMAKKVKRHFFNVRRSILELPDAVLGQFGLDINWDQADSDIKLLTSGVLRDAVRAGISVAEEQAKAKIPNYVKKDISEAQTLLDSYLALRVDKITGINRTIRKMLQGRIKTAIEGGLITGSTMTEIATGVRAVVRDYFNNAGVRAKLIARTEVTGAMNGGALAKAKDDGFEKKGWVTANDEVVRQSHRDCQSQGMIDIDEPFINGLHNAGDQDAGDAGEVVNCRCAIVFE